MSTSITFIAIFLFIIVFWIYTTKQNEQRLAEIVEQRIGYVKSIAPDAQIIVNNGVHLFFLDKVQQVFGIDESGNTYSFSGLLSIERFIDLLMTRRVPIAFCCCFFADRRNSLDSEEKTGYYEQDVGRHIK